MGLSIQVEMLPISYVNFCSRLPSLCNRTCFLGFQTRTLTHSSPLRKSTANCSSNRGEIGSTEWLATASPYQVLGVDESFSPAELKAAFRARVKEFHPDVCRDISDSDAIIRRVIQAYEILCTQINQAELNKSDCSDPFEAPECEALDLFVNETLCIGKGCSYSCVKRAPHAFSFIPMNGTARAISQEQTQEHISNQEEKPSISVRMEALSTELQVLKKEHKVLAEEAKGMTGSFPGADVSSALLFLGSDYETLKKKYVEECSERKRLYNEIIELRGNIRVFCRCRPLRPEETTHGSCSVVEFDQETELQIVCSDSSKKQFKFDHVFRPQDNQENVFSQTAPIVISVLDGYNVCIFAYGQTGTGKTFTMEGTEENRGVNYRTLEQLFGVARERNTTMKYELFVSMMEVYNEKIRDLLAENLHHTVNKVDIKQVSSGVQEVMGLSETQVYSTEEVWELLKKGGRARAVGSTNSNELSSRSHSLVRVTVRGASLVRDSIKSKSHLWLVDLAGSERLGKVEVEGERLKESQSINKSLSALGDVISALATKSSHVPYRNSKLTHLLQSSLGGDCKTVMFVQISPSASDLSETLCSLNFASRVRGIEYGPARKQLDHLEFFKFKQMAEKQKQDEKEARRIQESLQSLQLKFTARENLCRNLQEKVKELETQLAEERKTRLQQENRAANSKDHQKDPVIGKPPLYSFKQQRPPLSRDITNLVLNSSSRLRRSSSIISGKENAVSPPTTKPPLMKGRRRVSIASMASSAEPPSLQPQRRKISMTGRESFFTQIKEEAELTKFPNRRPITRHSLLPPNRRFSPLLKPAAVAATPDGKNSGIRSSGKRSMLSSWEPSLSTVSSPRLRRFLSSPINLRGLKNAQALNKFCGSLQKKVGSSPSMSQRQQLRLSPLPDVLSNQNIELRRGTEKLGSAQAFSNNYSTIRRRASFQPFLTPTSKP